MTTDELIASVKDAQRRGYIPLVSVSWISPEVVLRHPHIADHQLDLMMAKLRRHVEELKQSLSSDVTRDYFEAVVAEDKPSDDASVNYTVRLNVCFSCKGRGWVPDKPWKGESRYWSRCEYCLNAADLPMPDHKPIESDYVGGH